MTIAALAAPPSTSDQTGRPQGVAYASIGEPDPRRGDTILLPIDLDTTTVRLFGQPAALGAYVVTVSFAPGSIDILNVSPGEPPFTTPPFATAIATANATGRLRIASVTTEITAKARGPQRVAYVQLRERRPGAAGSVMVTLESAAAGLRRDENGKYPSRASILVRAEP